MKFNITLSDFYQVEQDGIECIYQKNETVGNRLAAIFVPSCELYVNYGKVWENDKFVSEMCKGCEYFKDNYKRPEPPNMEDYFNKEKWETVQRLDIDSYDNEPSTLEACIEQNPLINDYLGHGLKRYIQDYWDYLEKADKGDESCKGGVIKFKLDKCQLRDDEGLDCNDISDTEQTQITVLPHVIVIDYGLYQGVDVYVYYLDERDELFRRYILPNTTRDGDICTGCTYELMQIRKTEGIQPLSLFNAVWGTSFNDDLLSESIDNEGGILEYLINCGNIFKVEDRLNNADFLDEVIQHSYTIDEILDSHFNRS